MRFIRKRSQLWKTCVTKTDDGAEAENIDLQQLHDQICGDPVNAYFDTEAMEIMDARPGVQFDVAEAQRLWDAAGTGEVVEIPCEITPAMRRCSEICSLSKALPSAAAAGTA